MFGSRFFSDVSLDAVLSSAEQIISRQEEEDLKKVRESVCMMPRISVRTLWRPKYVGTLDAAKFGADFFALVKVQK